MTLPPWVRLVREPGLYPTLSPIISPAGIYELLRDAMTREEVEVFYVVALDVQNVPIHYVELTRGTINASIVMPREVFRIAIITGAASVIVAHNHPSGTTAPSADDKAVTAQLAAAGKVLDIPLYDHVIVAANGYFSFAEAGLL